MFMVCAYVTVIDFKGHHPCKWYWLLIHSDKLIKILFGFLSKSMQSHIHICIILSSFYGLIYVTCLVDYHYLESSQVPLVHQKFICLLIWTAEVKCNSMSNYITHTSYVDTQSTVRTLQYLRNVTCHKHLHNLALISLFCTMKGTISLTVVQTEVPIWLLWASELNIYSRSRLITNSDHSHISSVVRRAKFLILRLMAITSHSYLSACYRIPYTHHVTQLYVWKGLNLFYAWIII